MFTVRPSIILQFCSPIPYSPSLPLQGLSHWTWRKHLNLLSGVQFKGKDSSQVPASLGGWLLPPANSQPPLEKSPKSFSGRIMGPSYLSYINRLSVPQDRKFVPLAVRMKTAISCSLIYLHHLAKIYWVTV